MSSSVQVAKYISILGLLLVGMYGFAYLLPKIILFCHNYPYAALVLAIIVWVGSVGWYIIHTANWFGPNKR